METKTEMGNKPPNNNGNVALEALPEDEQSRWLTYSGNIKDLSILDALEYAKWLKKYNRKSK